MRSIFIMALLLLFFSNCNASINEMSLLTNVPTFNSKGDINIGYSFFSFPSYKTLGAINTSYLFTEKLAFIGSVYLRELGTKYSNKSLYDMGLGYYRNLGDQKNISIYLGYTNVQHEFIVSTKYDIVFREYYHLNKYYIQPSIGFNSKYIEAAISGRVAILDFYNTNSTYNKISEALKGQDPDGFFRLNLNDNNFFSFEPTVTVRAGWEFVRLQAQAALMLTNVKYSFNGLLGPGIKFLGVTNLNIGIVFTIPTASKSDK